MTNTIFTATGCTRCKIAKKFMAEQGIDYEELDIKAEGKDAFGQFYRQNRSAIFRGKEGVEFPVFTDGTAIRQGVGVVVAYLQADTKLDGFIRRSELSKGWIDGLHVSGGDPSRVDEFVNVLNCLKKNGLKLQLYTNGKNASVLGKLLENGLGDRVIMDVKGPVTLYDKILGEEIDPSEIKKTMTLVTRFPEYEFQTTIVPVVRQKGESPEINYLTPEEIGETAKHIEDATASKKQPYLLRIFDPEISADERLKSVEKLPPNALFKYRSAARKHQVLTEIEKA
jgi:pyruvate formate lyase activating enzyme